MAQPTTAAGTKLLILVGNGATPEVFGEPCGLTTKAMATTAASNDILVPDCDNPDDPAWLQREITSLSREITGQGVLAQSAVETYDDWITSGEAKNTKVKINGTGWYTWAGAARLTRFNITGQRGDKVMVDLTIVSDGAWTRADNA